MLDTEDSSSWVAMPGIFCAPLSTPLSLSPLSPSPLPVHDEVANMKNPCDGEGGGGVRVALWGSVWVMS